MGPGHIVPCPICHHTRLVDEEEYRLILRTGQFMCWDYCGHDVFAPTMWFWLNSWVETDEEVI
jgi:predicted metal-dependent phosphotriesterase family hydrolase